MKDKIDKLLEKVSLFLYFRLILMNLIPVIFFISILVLLAIDWDAVNLIFGIVTVLILVFNFSVLGKNFKNLKKMKQIIYSNIKEAQNELENAFYVNEREYILTENYIVDLRCYKIIKYGDIKFMYYHNKRSLTSRDAPLVLTLDTNKERVSLRVWSCYHLNQYYEDLESLIISKNPVVIKRKKTQKKNQKIES